MSPASDLHNLRNLSSSSGTVVVPQESVPDTITHPPLEPSSASPPEAAILSPCWREEAQKLAVLFPDGNASGILASERGNKPVWRWAPMGARDTGPEVLGDSWPELWESSKVTNKASLDGPPSAMGSVSSPPVQIKFPNCGAGGNIIDKVGTSGSFFNNVGSSSSSSISNPGKKFNKNPDKKLDKGNYSNWDHRPRDSHVWVDQGDGQRRHGGNIHRASYVTLHYENNGSNQWNAYRPLTVRDPQMQPCYPRVIQPHVPAMVPTLGPPPLPFQHFYGPMAYPDFSSQMYVLPTIPQPEHFKGYPFVAPPPPPSPSATVVSLHEHKRALILKQVEYYFSSENLCKDVYLRSHMDSHGWVSIHLVAGFKRMKLLTDDISIIVDALMPSRVVEVEEDRVRRRGDWDFWILKHTYSLNNIGSPNISQITKDKELLVSRIGNIALGNEAGRSNSDSSNHA